MPRAPRCAIIGAEATGAADYWYAKASSPIKTLQDTNGHTIAFSTNGSSTQSIVRAFIDEFKLTAKPMATGNPSVTLTSVMTDQVDVGWASPPFGLKEQEAGRIRVVTKATNSALVRGQTIRVMMTIGRRSRNARMRSIVSCRPIVRPSTTCIPTIRRSSKTTPPSCRCRNRRPSACATTSSRRALFDPDAIRGLDSVMKEAVNLKFINEPLTQKQLDELIQIPPRKKSRRKALDSVLMRSGGTSGAVNQFPVGRRSARLQPCGRT